MMDDYLSEGSFSGDCDDAATLAASFLLVLGILSVFIAIRMPYEINFSHVFVRVPGVIDIDPIVPAKLMPIQNYAERMEIYV